MIIDNNWYLDIIILVLFIVTFVFLLGLNANDFTEESLTNTYKSFRIIYFKKKIFQHSFKEFPISLIMLSRAIETYNKNQDNTLAE